MTNMTTFTLLQLAKKIKAQEITPIDLVKAYVQRIKEKDDEINAWVMVDEETALQEAEQLTKEIENGHIRSVFHGIPIGIKDIIDIQGLPTRHGSKAFAQADPATKDADIVTRLRKLGAIMLGKTKTAELAYFDPANTTNPYNVNHTPGGSSSGSAAAVAANMVPFSVGTQTNASVCRPAAYSGIGGFRPTKDRLPLDGVLSCSRSFDTLGFFGKRFIDAAAGYMAMDASKTKPIDLEKEGSSLRIGIVSDPMYDEASPGVTRVFDDTVSQLEKVGHTFDTVTPPFSFAEIVKYHNKMMAYEIGHGHETLVEEKGELVGEKFREIVADGLQIPQQEFEEAVQFANDCKEKMAEMFSGYDILLAPPTDTSAPASLQTTGNPRFTTPWTLLGVPLAVIPAGLDDNGLPLAVMCISAPDTDDVLIHHAISLEKQLKLIPAPII